MKAITLSYLAIVVCFVAGCATSSHIIVGVVRSPINPEQVKVYSVPPSRFEQIALLNVDSAGWTTQGEMNTAVETLKKEAARFGANGVLLSSRGTASSGLVGSNNPRTGAFLAAQSTSTVMQAVAIYVK